MSFFFLPPFFNLIIKSLNIDLNLEFDTMVIIYMRGFCELEINHPQEAVKTYS